jgi:SulP family sulfate permease
MVSGFQSLILSIPSTVRIVIIRMDKVPYVDQSGLYAMEEAILNLKQRNIDVLFVGISGQPKDMFMKIGIIPELVSNEKCFENAGDLERYLDTGLDD